jgi:hypothetical protein
VVDSSGFAGNTLLSDYPLGITSGSGFEGGSFCMNFVDE